MLAKMIDKIVKLKETKIFETTARPTLTQHSPASRLTSTALTPSTSADSIASAS